MEIRKIFAENLRNERLDRGLSQEALAHEAGLDRTYISSLERCVYSPTLDVVSRIASVLDIPPYRLLVPLPGDE